MNNMHQEAWLNFHADAQEAQQDLNRRYAKMVNAFGSYKKMPDAIKEIVKQDYAAHKAKWSENGEEQQKRFGIAEPTPAVKLTETAEQMSKQEQTGHRQAFLQKIQDQRQQQSNCNIEYEV